MLIHKSSRIPTTKLATSSKSLKPAKLIVVAALFALVFLCAHDVYAVEDQKVPEPTWKQEGQPQKAQKAQKAQQAQKAQRSANSANKERTQPYKAQHARAKKFMVVTANPHASKAAVQILEKGGSAADAAITAQLVLGLVEPQSSGIGGGAFTLHWNAEQKSLRSYDGRETAPEKIGTQHFLSKDGKPMGFWDAVIGGHSVGVPGVPALLSKLHKEHGTLPWKQLFDQAIFLAEQGFPVSERLRLLLKFVPKMREHPHVLDYFFVDGEIPETGHILRNPAYAKTLRQLRDKGVRSFYRGSIAKNIVAAVQQDKVRAGLLSLADMRSYRIIENEPLCASYRIYTLCGSAPPSSGGIAVLSILNMLQHWDTAGLAPTNPKRIHLFAEASRLAFADRNLWVGDPSAMPINPNTMLDPAYLRARSKTISVEHSNPLVSGGNFNSPVPNKSESNEPPSTSHLSIVDGSGNIISMTTSIEGAFGSRIMTGGFLLNNQLSDFSFMPRNANGGLVVNRPGPGKKPRSSMSPIIVFRTEGMRPYLVIGSPGGARIINYVAQSIWLYLDADTSLAQSLEMGRIAHLNKGALELEQGRYAPETIAALAALGHQIKQKRHGSGLHAIAIHANGRLYGAADPRREGLALGR
jgi:gamma-glutamyltranspeptidase/glutathione hydrolase